VGIQNKVLEAMACGTPVVASPQAVSALEAVDGQDVVVADGPDETAEAIGRLIEDEGMRLAIGSAGRRYVEMHHDWAEITGRLEEVYHEVIRFGV
jgi:glycosyltransferase involved in cell wall biosynthesis